MKKVFYAITMAAGVFAVTSCNQKPKETVVEEVVVNEIAEIVKDSLTDANGGTMYLTFNNPKGLVDIILKGDTITLKEDTTASGIKYSNNQYVYEEWQGNVTLKKDGSVVFEKK